MSDHRPEVNVLHARIITPLVRRLLVVTVLLIASAASSTRITQARVPVAAPATFPITLFPPDGLGQSDTVLISGNAPVDAAKLMAKITVTRPTGASTTIFAPMRKEDGFFVVCYNLTGLPGNYHIRVESPGGGAIGTKTFNVSVGFGPPDDDPVLGNLGVEFEHHIEGLVKSLPTSPAEQDLQAKLDQLRPQLATGLKEIQKYNAALNDVLTKLQGFPQDKPAFAGLFKKLDEWNDKAKTLEATLRDEMRGGPSDGVRCDDVAHLEKELTDLATLITDLQGPMKELVAFETTYRNARGVQLEDSLGCVAGQSVVKKQPIDPKLRDALSKFDPAEVPVAFFDAVLKIAGDAVNASSDQLFAVYCEKFEGPFSGSLNAVFSDKGTPWWKYTMALEGTLTVRYAKGSGGSGPLKVNGEFDGNVTDFSMKEDALRVLFPKLMRGALSFHKSLLPDTPAHFSIPVEGQIDKTTMTLDIANGGSDIASDTNAHVTYVVVTPLTLAPNVVKFDLPYKDVRFILQRAFNNKPAKFTLAVNQASKVITIAKVLTHTSGGPGATAYGQFKLSIKACNPACP